jgi:hypothetical protein
MLTVFVIMIVSLSGFSVLQHARGILGDTMPYIPTEETARVTRFLNFIFGVFVVTFGALALRGGLL